MAAICRTPVGGGGSCREYEQVEQKFIEIGRELVEIWFIYYQ
jgi:hypothetical protein